MHMHSLAPVLSATSRYVHIWIIGQPFLNRPSPPVATGGLSCGGKSSRRRLRRGRRVRGRHGGGLGDDAQQAPVLHLGQRPRLHDLDGIAGVRFVLLVVNVADGAAADVLAVADVLDQPRDLDAARLVHLVAGDDPDHHAALAAFLGRLLLLSHWPLPPSPPLPSEPSAGVRAGWSGCGPVRASPCGSRSASRGARSPTESGGGRGSSPRPSASARAAPRSCRVILPFSWLRIPDLTIPFWPLTRWAAGSPAGSGTAFYRQRGPAR